MVFRPSCSLNILWNGYKSPTNGQMVWNKMSWDMMLPCVRLSVTHHQERLFTFKPQFDAGKKKSAQWRRWRHNFLQLQRVRGSTWHCCWSGSADANPCSSLLICRSRFEQKAKVLLFISREWSKLWTQVADFKTHKLVNLPQTIQFYLFNFCFAALHAIKHTKYSQNVPDN